MEKVVQQHPVFTFKLVSAFALESGLAVRFWILVLSVADCFLPSPLIAKCLVCSSNAFLLLESRTVKF